MEIWQTLQEELNRLYEMFVQRNPYFEANGGKVSIVAHSLGCVVTYDILTGWTLDVEHSWYNHQTRGGGHGSVVVPPDMKRCSSRHFSPRGGGGGGGGGGPGVGQATPPSKSGLLFRIENFFCLGSPLSVFLTLRWRDPSNQEYHDHILPRSLCKYLYNIYHPCDPVAYRVEPIFMKFYGKVEPIHLHSANDANKLPYSDMPLQPLQNARKEDDKEDAASNSMLPVNIANGSINISMGKMLPSQATASLNKIPSMSPSLSLPKIPSMPSVPGLGGDLTGISSTSTSTGSTGYKGTNPYLTSNQSRLNGKGVEGAVNQVGAAAEGMLSGVFGMVKDASSMVKAASSTGSGLSTTKSTTTTSTAPGSRPGMPPMLPTATATSRLNQATNSMTSMFGNNHSSPNLARGGFNGQHHATQQQSATAAAAAAGAATGNQSLAGQQPSYCQEMKLPDGQRLAYRMDYVLRETGNTYIAAVTSHTSYWGNPDVAYFMLCKIHPELEYQKQQQHIQAQQQQQIKSNALSGHHINPQHVGATQHQQGNEQILHQQHASAPAVATSVMGHQQQYNQQLAMQQHQIGMNALSHSQQHPSNVYQHR